jgi:hypothetical protein
MKLPNDPDIERLDTAFGLVREGVQLKPDFSLARMFVNRKLGLDRCDRSTSLHVDWLDRSLNRTECVGRSPAHRQ